MGTARHAERGWGHTADMLRRRTSRNKIGRARCSSQAQLHITYNAAVALGAVLTMLAGAVLADLARCDCTVVVGRALAAVVDGHADKPTRLAGEWVGAAALEQADAGGRLGHGAACHAGTVNEERAVSADPAGVAGGNTIAPVTAPVEAPTARASL